MSQDEAQVGTPVIWWKVVPAKQGYIQPVDAVIADEPASKRRTPRVPILVMVDGKQVRRYADPEQLWRVEQEAVRS